MKFCKSTIDDILASAKKLPVVPLKAITEYQVKMPQMIDYVNQVLGSYRGIDAIIGNNPIEIMFDNHRHHASFMATVFSISGYELLAKTVPWVYRAYSSHGFSYDYFTLELKTWIQALEKYMKPDLSVETRQIYEWMLTRHEDMISISENDSLVLPPINADWLGKKNAFLSALLQGDSEACLEIAKNSCVEDDDIENFYIQVIQPCMYEVGMLWERAKISVAQEHLASAIVSKTMAIANMICSRKTCKTRGKALITTSPNEYHEIGGWMISDILERDGWDIRYLGANTPQKDIIQMLKTFLPDILAISVTMPFNIDKVKKLIDAIRNDVLIFDVKIMVGGRPFNEVDGLWKKVGADGHALNAVIAKNLAREWSKQKT